MQKLTHAQFNEINANFNEFHEIAELHAQATLIQVEYYDTQLDGEDSELYTVTTLTVEHPSDILHVFDHVHARTSVALNAANTARQTIVTNQQTLQRGEMVAFETSEDAMRYACDKVTQIGRARCYDA